MDAHVASPLSKEDADFFQKAGAGDDFWLGATKVKDGSAWLTKDNTEYEGLEAIHIFFEAFLR